MAITRAQQYRQMLKDGNFVMQGGVKNYLPSEMVTVPKKAKSSKDHPATELAYITKAEKDLLIKKDLHNSLNGKPNKGPSGVISLNGDYSDMLGGVTGADISAAERGEGPRGAMSEDRANELRAGVVAAGATGRDTDTDAIRKEAEKIKAASKARAAAEKAAITKEEKKEARLNYKEIQDRLKKDRAIRRDRISNILSRNTNYLDPRTGQIVDLSNYGVTGRELADLKSLGIDPNQEGPLTASQQQIFDQMMEKNDRFSGVNLENFQNKFDIPTTGITSLDLVTGLLEGPLSKGSKVNKEFFTDDVLGAGKFKYDGNVVNPEIFSMLNPSEMQEIYGDYMDKRMSGETDAYGNPTIPTPTGGGGGDNNQQQTDPCLGPNPPAYCNVGNDTEEEDATPSRNLGGLAPRFAGSIFDFTGLANGGIARAGAMDGGRMMMMANQEEDDPEGGIMDLETLRNQYFFGGIVKSAKKAVKSATRAVKKIAKSPIGKAALLYAGGAGLSALGAGSAGTGFGLKMFGPRAFASNLGMSLGKLGLGSKFIGPSQPKSFLDMIGGKVGAGILGTSALSYFMTPKEEEENNDDYYKTNKLNIADIRNNPYNYIAPRFAADGGLMRTGYAEGSEEPVAKKTMPLLDMDGQEMDLREEGGFVPLGRMERADDVPARLSKNEFVFTADAVRNAGEGDVDKGAEVMYNMMKNLESGGEVSEESQGLEGAREMFQTSQRLEEVI